MQNKITKEELEQEYPSGISLQFDPYKLPDLTVHQVVFFDEMHMDQEAEPSFRSKFQTPLPPHSIQTLSMHHCDRHQVLNSLNMRDSVSEARQ